jgi:hypothetical protein
MPEDRPRAGGPTRHLRIRAVRPDPQHLQVLPDACIHTGETDVGSAAEFADIRRRPGRRRAGLRRPTGETRRSFRVTPATCAVPPTVHSPSGWLTPCCAGATVVRPVPGACGWSPAGPWQAAAPGSHRREGRHPPPTDQRPISCCGTELPRPARGSIQSLEPMLGSSRHSLRVVEHVERFLYLLGNASPLGDWVALFRAQSRTACSRPTGPVVPTRRRVCFRPRGCVVTFLPFSTKRTLCHPAARRCPRSSRSRETGCPKRSGPSSHRPVSRRCRRP